MLALGAVSNKLLKEGKINRARRAVQWTHSMLGLHGRNNNLTPSLKVRCSKTKKDLSIQNLNKIMFNFDKQR